MGQPSLGDLMPLIVTGILGLAGYLAVARYADRAPGAWSLTPIFLKPNGPYGFASRRELWLRSAQILSTALILFTLGFVVMILSENAAPQSGLQFSLLGVFFILLMLSLVLGLDAVVHAGRAAIRSTLPIAGNDVMIAEALGDYLHHAALAPRDERPWPDFGWFRYKSEELEAIRLDLVARFPKSRPPETGADGEALEALGERALQASIDLRTPRVD